MRGSEDDEVHLAGEGIGFGKIMSIHNDSLVGQVYFEIHPDQLQGSGMITVELYGDVGFGPNDCAEHGTLLTHATIDADSTIKNTWSDTGHRFSSRIFRFDSYNSVFRDLHVECHPRANGAVMAAAEYTIFNPFNPFNQSSIWFPDSKTSTRGRLDYCIRIQVNKPPTTRSLQPNLSDIKAASSASKLSGGEEEPEGGAETSGYDTKLDTKIRIEGDRLEAGFQNDSSKSDKEVTSTHSSQAVESLTEFEHSQKISAFAFSCSDGGRGKYNDFGTIVPSSMSYGDARRTFAVGQVFRICVSPSQEFEKDYSVVAFESVVCENFGEARGLFENFKAIGDFMEIDDASYTSSERNTMSYVNLETAAIATAANTLSFRTMVTPGFRGLNETSLVCSGIVSLRYASSSNNDGGFNITNFTLAESKLLVRAKQKTYRSDFSLSIDLLAPGTVTAAPIEEEVRPKRWKLGLTLFAIFWIGFLALLDYTLNRANRSDYDLVSSRKSCYYCLTHSDPEKDNDHDEYGNHHWYSKNICCSFWNQSDPEKGNGGDGDGNHRCDGSSFCCYYRHHSDTETVKDEDDDYYYHRRRHRRSHRKELRFDHRRRRRDHHRDKYRHDQHHHRSDRRRNDHHRHHKHHHDRHRRHGDKNHHRHNHTNHNKHKRKNRVEESSRDLSHTAKPQTTDQ